MERRKNEPNNIDRIKTEEELRDNQITQKQDQEKKRKKITLRNPPEPSSTFRKSTGIEPSSAEAPLSGPANLSPSLFQKPSTCIPSYILKEKDEED